MLCKANFTSFFPGHYRLRGIEIGALVSGIVRVAIPFAWRVILPAAKKSGGDFLLSLTPEMIDVDMKKGLINKHRKTLSQKLQ